MSEEIKQESLSLETSESDSTSVSESTSTSTSTSESISESTSISDSVSSSESTEEPIIESETVSEATTSEETQDESTEETEEKISVILKDGTDISDVAFMNGIFLLVPYEKRKKASEYYSGITINGTTYDEVVAFKVTLEKQGDYYAINYHLDDEEEEE